MSPHISIYIYTRLIKIYENILEKGLKYNVQKLLNWFDFEILYGTIKLKGILYYHLSDN